MVDALGLQFLAGEGYKIPTFNFPPFEFKLIFNELCAMYIYNSVFFNAQKYNNMFN